MVINFFVKQTAEDYDLENDVVQEIYDKYFVAGKFYEKLEEYIK